MTCNDPETTKIRVSQALGIIRVSPRTPRGVPKVFVSWSRGEFFVRVELRTQLGLIPKPPRDQRRCPGGLRRLLRHCFSSRAPLRNCCRYRNSSVTGDCDSKEHPTITIPPFRPGFSILTVFLKRKRFLLLTQSSSSSFYPRLCSLQIRVFRFPALVQQCRLPRISITTITSTNTYKMPLFNVRIPCGCGSDALLTFIQGHSQRKRLSGGAQQGEGKGQV